MYECLALCQDVLVQNMADACGVDNWRCPLCELESSRCGYMPEQQNKANSKEISKTFVREYPDAENVSQAEQVIVHWRGMMIIR